MRGNFVARHFDVENLAKAQSATADDTPLCVCATATYEFLFIMTGGRDASAACVAYSYTVKEKSSHPMPPPSVTLNTSMRVVSGYAERFIRIGV